MKKIIKVIEASLSEMIVLLVLLIFAQNNVLTKNTVS